MSQCLTCQSNSIKIKSWQNFSINECLNCQFCWIDFDSQDDDSVEGSESSITTDSFYEQALEEHQIRQVYFKKIVKNRIYQYSKILDRPFKSILEVGCGSGACKKGFEDNDISWSGIEINNDMYDFWSKNNINILKGDFIKFQFDKQFDVIYASQVLEHINDPIKFIKKCKEVLAPGGLIHVDVPNHKSLISYLRKYSFSSSDYGAIRPPEHMRAYSKNSLSALFSFNGLDVVSVFNVANNDKVFGQLVLNIPFFKKIVFLISKFLRMQSLLVGIAKIK